MQDDLLLQKIADDSTSKNTAFNLYAEKFPQLPGNYLFNRQHLPIDEGTVYNALETVVYACGFPFVSDFDYSLPVALKRAKGTDKSLLFSVPDYFFPCRNYAGTLIKNGAFHDVIEKNIQDFIPNTCLFPSYPTLISNFMSMEISTHFPGGTLSLHSQLSQKFRTILRRILLDIISKDHAPLLAFFKRSELLRLCEGGFAFSAYLVKLNMWFEIFSPKIV